MAMKSSHIPITSQKQDISCFYVFSIHLYLVKSIKKYRNIFIFFKKSTINKYMENISIHDIVVRIDTLLKQRKESRKELADVIGKNHQVFVDWKNKNISPSAVDLYKMAKHLGVTYDYLLLGKKDQYPDDIALAMVKLQTLTKEQREPIIALIESQVKYWKKVYSKEN